MSWKVTLLGSQNSNYYVSNVQILFNGGSYIEFDELQDDYLSGLSFIKLGDIVSKNITVIDKTTDVLTSIGHRLNNGDAIYISGNANPSYYSFLSGFYVISDKTTDTFKLKEAVLNSSDFLLVELDNYGVKPHIIDESERKYYYGGSFRQQKVGRLGFEFNPIQFITRGDPGRFQENDVYWNLMSVLYSPYIWIMNFGDNFERISALKTKYPTIVTYPTKPMPVEVLSIEELTDNYDKNNNSMGFTLAIKQIFTI